tara:strand:- start:324 stop:665 length:342 start_codon:yes stop_codon:yes gene_type:complete
MTDYKKQYLKYKKKYLKIKKMFHGGDEKKQTKQEIIQEAIKKEKHNYAKEDAEAYKLIARQDEQTFSEIVDKMNTINKAEKEKEDAVTQRNILNTVSIITVIGSIVGLVFLIK